MERTINVKELRASMPDIVRRVGRGERFTVLYRSRPAFRLVPVAPEEAELPPLEEDPIYRMGALVHSDDGGLAEEHDDVLYGWKR